MTQVRNEPVGTFEGRCARRPSPALALPAAVADLETFSVGSVSSQPRQAALLSQVTFGLALWGTCCSGSRAIPEEEPSTGESCLCPARVWGPGATVNALPAPPWGCDGCEPSRVAVGAGATCPLGLWTGLGTELPREGRWARWGVKGLGVGSGRKPGQRAQFPQTKGGSEGGQTAF